MRNLPRLSDVPTWQDVLSAEHFVHAKRSAKDRIGSTQDVAEAIRYIRRAYREHGIRSIPCLTKRGCDCVPEREGNQ